MAYHRSVGLKPSTFLSVSHAEGGFYFLAIEQTSISVAKEKYQP